jgi:hypothetical protein
MTLKLVKNKLAYIANSTPFSKDIQKQRCKILPFFIEGRGQSLILFYWLAALNLKLYP